MWLVLVLRCVLSAPLLLAPVLCAVCHVLLCAVSVLCVPLCCSALCLLYVLPRAAVCCDGMLCRCSLSALFTDFIQATKVLVTRRSDPAPKWQLVICGASMTALGLGVYFLMPMALLSGSITILLDIFFVLLITMLLGLVVFAMNICRMFEMLIMAVLLWCWEHAAVYRAVRLNLAAHRVRNRHSQVAPVHPRVSILCTDLVCTGHKLRGVHLVHFKASGDFQC